eukprot:TRINITY_DN276_c0_g1_i1.p1 TRINITY_DN276_c0_g1~~TRINITY_DN276_c0_g1_i1.p1  ORF type:complete len:403 (+),score=126.39 TRINITY_DN276_c0_g1_i1:47-1255(+)
MRTLVLLSMSIALVESRHLTTGRLQKECHEGSCRNSKGRCEKGAFTPCLRRPCDDNPCAEGELCWDNYCNGCHAVCLKPKTCSDRIKRCADGTELKRDPFNNCHYPQCPEPVCDIPKDWVVVSADTEKCAEIRYKCLPEQVGWSNRCGCGCKPAPCTKDAMICPDGTTVVRDPKNGCKFPECPKPECELPKGWTLVADSLEKCAATTFLCTDGMEQWLNKCGCGCRPRIFCPLEDIKFCEDGSTVKRDPNLNCEFPECPTKMCTQDVKTCPDGSFVSRDPKNGCAFRECPLRACTEDARICPDGTTVVRDPKNNCEFPECPKPKCDLPKDWTVVADSTEKCALVKFICADGMEQWFNECGCGCKPSEPKCDLPKDWTVVADSVEKCALVKFPEGLDPCRRLS